MQCLRIKNLGVLLARALCNQKGLVLEEGGSEGSTMLSQKENRGPYVCLLKCPPIF